MYLAFSATEQYIPALWDINYVLNEAFVRNPGSIYQTGAKDSALGVHVQVMVTDQREKIRYSYLCKIDTWQKLILVFIFKLVP